MRSAGALFSSENVWPTPDGKATERMEQTSGHAGPTDLAPLWNRAEFAAIAVRILPASCREHVLQNLPLERDRSSGRYLWQVLWTVIRALGGQVRNTTAVRIFLLEACTVVYSFTASAFHNDRPSVVGDPLALVKLAIPATTVLAVLLLRNAWAGNEERPQLASTIDVSLAFGLVVLLQAALWQYFPALVLPRWRPTQGSWAAWLFLTEVRTMFPPYLSLRQASPVTRLPMYLDEIRWRAEELERDLRRRNRWVCFVAAAILALFGACFAQTGVARARIGSALIIAGTLYILWLLWNGGTPRSVPAGEDFGLYRNFCRSELDRQCTMLRRIRYSYVGVLLPGLLLVLAGSMVYVYVVVMYVLLIAELIHRAIVRLQQEQSDVTSACAVPTLAPS